MQGEVQAVTKVYDILKWLIPQISRFPRSHKFTLGDRVTNLGLDVLMLLVEANYTRDKTELLQQANQKLEQLRYLLRLCKELIRRKIRDKQTLWLIDLIIDSSNPQEPVTAYFPDDDLFVPMQRRHGIPIGNLTSQFFANVYLNPLDHLVKEQLGCRHYIRYCDDFVILADDKDWLQEVKFQIGEYLMLLRLKLHPRKCQVFPVKDGTDFLGYRVFPTHRLVRKDSITRFRRRMRRLQAEYAKGEVSLSHIRQSIQSWLGHVSHVDSYGLRRQLLQEVSFVKT